MPRRIQTSCVDIGWDKMKDVEVIAEAEEIGKEVYMVNCPTCGDGSRLEEISKAWSLGYRCLECGLIFKTDYRNIAGNK